MCAALTNEWPARSELFRSVDKLEREYPRIAAERVPAGITRYWGFMLGWPDWLWKDTPYSHEKELPNSLPLSDDLRLLANLCSHCGYMELLTLLDQMPRAPGEKQDVHAPDLEIALETKIRLISLRNPQANLYFKRNAQYAVVEIEVDEAAGAFSVIYELSLLVILYRLARSFTGYAPDQSALLSQVEMHTTLSDQRLISGLGELLQCKLQTGQRRAALHVPKVVLSLKSPEYDQFAWESIKTELAKLEHKSASDLPLSRDYLTQIVQADLRENGKARTLVQLADRIGMAERTLSRSLTNQGTSLKNIKTKARMDLAKELLRDPDLSLDQISAKLAYSEASSFVRAFRKQFGETPGRWRMREEQ